MVYAFLLDGTTFRNNNYIVALGAMPQRNGMMRAFGILSIFLTGWLLNIVVDVNSALGIVDGWVRHGWLAPWYNLIAQ